MFNKFVLCFRANYILIVIMNNLVPTPSRSSSSSSFPLIIGVGIGIIIGSLATCIFQKCFKTHDTSEENKQENYTYQSSLSSSSSSDNDESDDNN